MSKLKWGIIGTGLIAKELADGVIGGETGELLAVGSRTQEAADKFGDAYRIPRRYSSYEALLADKEKAMLAVSNELEATMKYTNNLNKALECAKLKNAATKALIDDAYTHEQTLKATLDGMASSTAQRMQLVVDAWKATMTMKPVRISAPEVNTV